MNYELAEKLKEAGWQFKYGVGKDGKVVVFDDLSPNQLPTLEELIEACEPFIVSLEFRVNGCIAKGVQIFEEITEPDKHFLQVGKTPTEAVAHLWLSLQGNNN